MRLVILDTSASVGDWAARYVMKRIKDFNPGPDNYFVLGLPTGNVKFFVIKELFQKWRKF